jgi:uncharacterized protein DUF1186/SEC-C motif-containing protein
MEIVEILERIDRETGKFERAAVGAALARREEITPELLRILDDTVNRAAELEAEGDYLAHFYAMFLLAQFRERRAYPLVLRFALLPGDLLDSLAGDFVTAGLGQVLASVCGGDLKGIQSLIENEDADEWARGAGLDALVTLVAAGQKSREEIVSYFATLFRCKLTRKRSNVWDALALCCSDLCAAELIEDIELAYAAGLVDAGMMGLEDIEADLALGKDGVLARLADDPDRHLVDDVEEEFGWWACFCENKPSWLQTASVAGSMAGHAAGVSPSPITTIKTGRNEPCPCGSGKKYKKCCGG